MISYLRTTLSDVMDFVVAQRPYNVGTGVEIFEIDLCGRFIDARIHGAIARPVNERKHFIWRRIEI